MAKPKPVLKVMFVARMPVKLAEAVDRLAKKRGMTRTAIVTEALQAYLPQKG